MRGSGEAPAVGRVPNLCLQDRLLLTLTYWREYRTYAHIAYAHIAYAHIAYAHIAQTYGLSESAVCRTVHLVEAALMRSGAFRLLGKKALTRSETEARPTTMGPSWMRPSAR